MFCSATPIDLIQKWEPHLIQQYSADIDCEISERQAYNIKNIIPQCPIKEFQQDKDGTIFCILRNEFEHLFEKKILKAQDFCPIDIFFERNDPLELPINAEIVGEENYTYFFDQVFQQFLIYWQTADFCNT